MKYLDKLKYILLFVLALNAISSLAQTSAVIKGEVSAGSYANVKVDSSGVMATSSLASTTGGFSKYYVTSAGTTTGKVGEGTLHTINVNTKGTGSTLTVYDALSAGTSTIAVIDTASAVGSLRYDVALNNGLTVVSTGTGTAAANVTVTYK